MSGRTATCLSIQFRLDVSSDVGRDELHAHGDRVMDELLNLEQCNDDFTDSSVSTDAAAKTITIDLLVWDVTEPAAAIRRALDIIRPAVHAAGGSTPRWPIVIEEPDHVEMAKAHDLVPA